MVEYERESNRRWFDIWDDKLQKLPHALLRLPLVLCCGLAVLIAIAATALRWAILPWIEPIVPYNVASPRYEVNQI